MSRARVLSHFSHVRLCETPWTGTSEAPLFMGSRQEYWSGLPCPPPGPLPNPGIKCVSYVSFIGRWILTASATWEALFMSTLIFFFYIPTASTPRVPECSMPTVPSVLPKFTLQIGCHYLCAFFPFNTSLLLLFSILVRYTHCKTYYLATFQYIAQ